MNVEIRDIPEKLKNGAVDLFAEAFAGDPLFVFAFPDEDVRKIQTRVMYEFVVLTMVPMLNLAMKGAFDEECLAGCMIYSTPERKGWGENIIDALDRMRKKSNDERINLIGGFAVLEGFTPGVPYFYGNELAVKKEYRNKGIGKALCDFLTDECRRHPLAEGIAIDTANESNVKLYEKWGWELKAVKDFYTIKKYFMWKKT
jgi:GNAT superfamily N-acetyltransferase